MISSHVFYDLPHHADDRAISISGLILFPELQLLNCNWIPTKTFRGNMIKEVSLSFPYYICFFIFSINGIAILLSSYARPFHGPSSALWFSLPPLHLSPISNKQQILSDRPQITTVSSLLLLFCFSRGPYHFISPEAFPCAHMWSGALWRQPHQSG